ncbi:hypothetical protein [Coxiella endosymbiont of Ornithodoros maritimus]|uniref:hypothetical protein n=1 Tax=Coxiella endosymbiont of Ornithodoros maritimus TaxID=1656172 RepID=UPI0038994E04
MGDSQFIFPSALSAVAATNYDPDVFAHAVAQVKTALDITQQLNGKNYVLWGGREGHETLLNTDLKKSSINPTDF